MGNVRYEPAGFVMLRAPTLPASTIDALYGPSANDAAIDTFAQQPLVRLALRLASEDLRTGMDRVLDEAVNGTVNTKRARRLQSRLLRYLVRMSTRPTPFGLLSGVAMGTVRDGCAARLNGVIRSRTRCDMGWLLALISQLESTSTLRPFLDLVANPLAYVAGDRVCLPYADTDGSDDQREISVRATPVVREILDFTSTPRPYADVADHILVVFPQALRTQVLTALEQLCDVNVLTSDLRPPMTTARPDRYLANRLQAIPAASATMTALHEVLDLLGEVDRIIHSGRMAAADSLVPGVIDRQRRLVPGYTGPTVQVDTCLGTDELELPNAVTEAAASAFDALRRTTRLRPLSPDLTAYHMAFVGKYGFEGVVPLLDLLSPEFGLDSPPGCQRPQRRYPLPLAPALPKSNVDDVLLELYAACLNGGAQEIDLSDQVLDRLAAPVTTARQPLPAVDVVMQIAAKDPATLRHGEWTAVLATTPFAFGGQFFGRFTDLLDDRDEDRLREFVRLQEAMDPGVIFAEVSHLPLYGRGVNVMLHSGLRTWEIPVNVSPSVPADRVVPLSDILVSLSTDGFRFHSARSGAEIVATQSHMLNPELMPAACRFLLDASAARWQPVSAFSWGPLRGAPYLPRVRRGRVVLRPAQWTLRREQAESIQRWRDRWHVPRWVYLVERDNRLLLDLDHPSCSDIVSDTLRTKDFIELQEMYPGFDDLWFTDPSGQGYLCELVVPLRKSRSATTEPTRPAVPKPHVRAADRIKLPGGEWSSLKVYCPFSRMDEIIATRLGELVGELADRTDRWFFLRYADAAPHLRIRFHTDDPAKSTEVAGSMLSWGRRLVSDGKAEQLVLDTYRPEFERYGGPAALPAIEQLFHGNSMTALQLVASHHRSDPHWTATAIASLDRTLVQWGLDIEQRLAVVPQPADIRNELPQADRILLARLIADRPEDDEWAAIRSHIAAATEPHRPVIEHAAHTLHELATTDSLWTDERGILRSITHMQVNRLFGVQPRLERQCYVHWRAALRSASHLRNMVHKAFR